MENEKKEPKKQMTASDMGKKGGAVTKARYGVEHFKKISHMRKIYTNKSAKK